MRATALSLLLAAALLVPDPAEAQGCIEPIPGLLNCTGIVELGGNVVFDVDLVLQPGSTLIVDFEPAVDFEPGIDNEALSVIRTATIGSGSTLQIRNDAGLPIGGTVFSFTVLTADDGFSGSFDALELTGPGAAFGVLTPGPGDPFVAAVEVEYDYTGGFGRFAGSPNDHRVARYLDPYLDPTTLMSTDPDFQQFVGQLTSSAAGVQEGLDTLDAEVYDAHTSASFATARHFADLLARRPLRCEQWVSPYRPKTPSLAPCSDAGWIGWVDGFGTYADHEGRPGWADWSYAGGGIAVGADRRLSEHVLLSALLGTSRMGLDFDARGDGSATSFDLGLAAAWQRGPTHVRGVFAYGHGWHTTHRQVDFAPFSRLATSDHDSDRVTLLAEAGYELELGLLKLEPLAALEYTWLDEDAARESGAGVVDLDVGSRSNVLFATDAGLRAGLTLVKYGYAGAWLEWADGVWRPEIQAVWHQVWNDYDRATSARLQGAPSGAPALRTQSEDSQYGGRLSAGVSFQPDGTRNTVHLGYDAFVGQGTQVHTLSAKLRIPF